VKIARALMGVFAMGLGACAAAPESGGSPPAPKPAATASAQPSLVGTRWKGVIDAAVNPAATPWLEFGDGRVSGYSGCNMLNGAWRSDGGQVRIGPLAMTKRGCMGPEGDVEKRLMSVLNEQGRVSREGNKLVITGPNGDRFEFVLATS
jgi:heat shock protein HslJ